MGYADRPAIGRGKTPHAKAGRCAFSHPDYTVGSGIPPDHAAARDVFPAPPLAGSHRRSGLGARQELLPLTSARLTQPRRLIHLPMDSIAEIPRRQPLPLGMTQCLGKSLVEQLEKPLTERRDEGRRHTPDQRDVDEVVLAR